MTPDRPLFFQTPEERALLAFYDLVPAAEVLAASYRLDQISAADFIEPAVTPAQAVALVIDRLGATLVEEDRSPDL